MLEAIQEQALGWEPDELSIELALEDVMAELDPGWQSWSGPTAVGQ